MSSITAPQPPLPQGWVRRWDECYRRVYFVKEKTGAIQWEEPSIPSRRVSLCEPRKDSSLFSSEKLVIPDADAKERIGSRIGLKSCQNETSWALTDRDMDELDRII